MIYPPAGGGCCIVSVWRFDPYWRFAISRYLKISYPLLLALGGALVFTFILMLNTPTDFLPRH